MALILSSALGFSPTTHVRTVHSAAVSRPAIVMMDSPFAFDFGKIFDGIKSGIDDMTKGMAGNKGDASDIDVYCRDDESSGCDYEMLAQMKAKEVLQEPGLKLESEWSAEIDAAVSSSAPKM